MGGLAFHSAAYNSPELLQKRTEAMKKRAFIRGSGENRKTILEIEKRNPLPSPEMAQILFHVLQSEQITIFIIKT